jgi:divalent metal cation (Fe/Co/Zn/Cd) transporter
VRDALPDSDVVVHLEPREDNLNLRDRALATALGQPAVREAHDIAIYRSGSRASISLHLKLPAEILLSDAHEVAEQVERELERDPGVIAVHTHLEPLELPVAVNGRGDDLRDDDERRRIRALVRDRIGTRPCEIELLRTDVGLVVFLTVSVGIEMSLADAHDLASRLEDDIRQGRSYIADVVVHTEP